MIRAIGNTPAPVPTPEPTPQTKLRRYDAPAPEPAPEPVPSEDTGKNLAFKGIFIKNIPGDTPVTKYYDFLYSAKPIKSLRAGISRKELDGRPEGTFLSHYTKGVDLLRGKTKAQEELVYRDLVANKHMMPEVEIQKIDDWV